METRVAMAASTPIASPFKRQSKAPEPKERNKSALQRQENKNLDLKRKRYPAEDSRGSYQSSERQAIGWNGTNKYRPNHPRMAYQPGAQDRRMDPRHSSRPFQRSAGTWHPHRQPSHHHQQQQQQQQQQHQQRPDRRPGTINNNLGHYGPADDRHCEKLNCEHRNLNFDTQHANQWNNARPIGSKPRWERQPSFTPTIPYSVNQDILRPDPRISQGSSSINAEIRRDEYGSEPRFRKESVASFVERVELPKGKMRDPNARESTLAFATLAPIHKFDSSQRETFVKSSSCRSDGSSNKESHKSDSFAYPSSSVGVQIPRDISGRNQREKISREERKPFSSGNCSLYNQRSIVANVMMSIPHVPKLNHVEQHPANKLQDLNRWMPPKKKELSTPDHTHAQKYDSKLVPTIWSDEKISDEKKTAMAETYDLGNARTQNDSWKKRMGTTVSQEEETTKNTNAIRSDTPSLRHADRTVGTSRNSNGIKFCLEKTKLDSVEVSQYTAAQELPIQDRTTTTLDSSENGRLYSKRQVLPLTPVVSESPHSASHSMVDLRFELTEREPMPTVGLIDCNTRSTNGKDSSGFTSCGVGINASSDEDSSDSDTDEEELMEWAQTMFGIPRTPPVPHEVVKLCDDSSDVTDDESFFSRSQNQVNMLGTKPFTEAIVKDEKCIINISIVALKTEEEAKTFPAASRIKRGKESEDERLKRAAEAKIRKDQAKSMTAAEIKAILGDEAIVAPSTNWVRRSVRQPAQSTLTSTNVKNLIDKLKYNESDMVVLKMKKYINDPDTPSVVIDAALDALGDNSNCEALYIQNFNKGMRDAQVLRLLEVLMLPTCQIWCLNIGETYNVKAKTWKQFAIGLRKTKVTHMYASEHTISGELKDRIRETIRNNRKKHDKHSNPNNLDVIIQCTHCWWNPINAKSLRPYLKNKGYEQLLMDKEAQGLQGSNSGANL